MTKDKLHGILQTIKNNYSLVQAGIMFLAQPDAVSKFDEYSVPFLEHVEGKQFLYIRYVLEDDDLLALSTNQLRKSVLRNCVKEMFETVKFYGTETNQMSLIRTAPWYQFLRMTRNSVSHDFILRFNEHDLKILPVGWSGLMLTASMNNTELPMNGFLTRMKILELMDEIIEYIELNVT
ncbi:hypothetical protein [Rugamonas sp. DEMB1]|uniref:hypothetical protein n=1 Tax=Rugamonas sp. DEMB1 TaxID=3039386 RepID=UPI00244A342E|nr:hypothetical protein [Rugamonas sp. DEMB1]WGG50478.1 hypothetical protein QC826_29430 [Rugamonas sp. DEMB1]